MSRYSCFFPFLLLLAGCAPQNPADNADTSPNAPALVFDPADLSADSRPQDDFYAYVNGNWQARTEIPPEWPRYGVVIQLVEKTELQLRKLLQELLQQTPADDSEAQKINALYSSFMDEEAVEGLGLEPLQAELQTIAALRDTAELPGYFGEALHNGITGPVDFYVDAAGDNPQQNLLYFWQSGLTLPDRDYYLQDSEKFITIRASLLTHVERMFMLAGEAEPQLAAESVIAIEQALADAQWSRVQSRDRETIYRNQFTAAAAEQLTKEFNWGDLVRAMGANPEATAVLAQSDYFAALGGIVNRFPIEQWQYYLKFRLLKHYAPYLTAAFVAENFDFDGRVLRGSEKQRERWQRGIRLVNQSAGEMLGKLYVERHFPAEYKQRMEVLVEDLRSAFSASIDELEWMSPATRQQAQQKLQAFNYKIAYPDKWRDYSGLQFSADELAGNVRRALRFEHERQLGKLEKPVDRSEWGMTPQTVNAYYRPTFNEIVFPAAFLQPPFFDPAADDAHNYAAIGSVIGHEFSHGFDDQGRKFDAAGQLRNWWTEGDAQRFQALTEGLVKQYDAFQPLPDVSLNGRLTLGENIADLAGLVMAWRAYQLSLGGKPAPEIDGYTAEQRFLIGYSLSNRSNWRPEFLRKILVSDPHSPDRYRVLGVLPNMDIFYETYDVQPGDAMYLPPADRVAIW